MIDPPWHAQQQAPPPPPRNPNVAPFNSPFHDRLCRAGLWLGVLSAALCIIAGFGDRVVARQDGSSVSYVTAGFIAPGVIFAVLIGLAVFLPFAWARISGIGLLSVAAFTYAVMVFVARVDDTNLVAPGPDITLGDGGLMLVLAFLAASLGLAFALVGSPRIGRPARLNADGSPITGQSGYSVASLVLALSGIVVGFTAPLGIAFAVAAFDDGDKSNGHRTGRGLAVAGLVVGIVIVALSALFMALFIGTADPSFNQT